MSLQFSADANAFPLHIVEIKDLTGFLETLPVAQKNWAVASGFSATLGSALVLHHADGTLAGGVIGYGDAKSRKRGRFHVAAAVEKLPQGSWQIVSDHSQEMLEETALGWLLASYRFDRYKTQSSLKARLVAPDGVDAAKIEAIATGEALTRDLINTPSSDMGPAELEAVARDLAEQHDAAIEVISGQDLLTENLPMLHDVGRASSRVPRLLDMTWGAEGPTLVLVGKGVCFDTGGLNLKPGGSMGLMKKDMGGSAAVLGLAHMIMALDLKLRLRVLIPAVENSVSSNSYRPQDVLTSRKGLTVEINNTDAEGRLVLADALTLADERKPDLIISMATLTGAARVAVGPDLVPFYTDDSAAATSLFQSGEKIADPLWRMPFHAPYETMIEPAIADLDNAPKGGFAGSITAALFLRRFVSEDQPYVHFDMYGWQPTSEPGRPKGGVGQGTRAILDALPDLLDL
ncbi:leucyl aminopeptidase family protein [Halocynthiibacter namhaensis]|uniref:leucyl aminopeptidase family protein n=1 Tax=Halocynthiibacter namhaensis TaxID=1290553 RepID=UPI0005795FAD|nr:leucyl aminopeptidase family protein [Halocynthiibacter namhaensis]